KEADPDRDADNQGRELGALLSRRPHDLAELRAHLGEKLADPPTLLRQVWSQRGPQNRPARRLGDYRTAPRPSELSGHDFVASVPVACPYRRALARVRTGCPSSRFLFTCLLFAPPRVAGAAGL